ncbi:effector-associated constant component EACC1 [Amycolatopsis eburnea]|uniref:Uncharacterized protein n=1 Tax=Amycolatopsis eburnea TaxID=2267691 RepID=A0A3R9FEK2_9PSEU|nr:hypothetical protein [Amycolatopsis eburnea]RSD07442.1 hypothetical protein EIY87_47245 [Amycolatopsis eburnea]
MPTYSLEVRDDDPAVRDRLHRQLRQELLGLDVDEARFAVDHELPPGAKADPAGIAAIVVSLATSPVLLQLAGAVRDWAKRSAGRKIVIRDGDRSLEITGASADDNQRVIEEFFADGQIEE